ncbi:TolC family protein [Paraburkholderia sp. J94]|uniref:TolC family protein n=1 Tax=Paraburkholderia sp. J94 TaxID=2805441 RepID=UPI002AB19E4A|nr:TolC family protein [Paraburkholderia sp. J94]
MREALDRSLCNDPKLRAAWVDIKVKAAQLGQADAAYLPTVSANYQGLRDDSATDVHGYPRLSAANQSFIQTVDATATLVIWDFGARSSAARAARELVLAATATYRATLQTAIANVSKDYFSAIGAEGQVSAAQKTLAVAQQTFTAAIARVEHGVAPISDKLQAETSLQEAVYAAQKAGSDARAAKGILSIDMGQAPTTVYALPDMQSAIRVGSVNGSSVHELLEEADIGDPSIAAALAQLDAARASVDKAKADGMPTISLTTKYTLNNQPASLGLGVAEFPATGHDWYFGVVVRIPVFDGFSRSYQIREAEATVEAKLEAVRDARKQVATGIWTNYEAVTLSEQNVESSERLLDIANSSFDAANRRYRLGAGSILEVLNAQSALARAQKGLVSSLTDYATATLQLAAKLGRLRDWE